MSVAIKIYDIDKNIHILKNKITFSWITGINVQSDCYNCIFQKVRKFYFPAHNKLSCNAKKSIQASFVFYSEPPLESTITHFCVFVTRHILPQLMDSKEFLTCLKVVQQKKAIIWNIMQKDCKCAELHYGDFIVKKEFLSVDGDVTNNFFMQLKYPESFAGKFGIEKDLAIQNLSNIGIFVPVYNKNIYLEH